MATYTAVPESFIAAADLSAGQHKFVEQTAANTVNVCNSLGEAAIGILENKPDAAGKAAAVWMVSKGGKAKVMLSATIAAGVEVTTAADGRAVTAATGHRVLGRLLEGGDANEIVAIDLYAGRVVP